ncbi:MAG: hypothetical protein IK081_16615 [Lachnospiraceae bacterium]|nr:hypothetical protein [Lachnospiraceae bacterium]
MKVRDIFRVKKKRALEFSPRLYYGEGISPDDLEKLKDKICSKPLLSNVFLLLLPENDSDQIEILSSRYFVQPYYGDHSVKVVGIANDHADAVALVLKITEDCMAIRKDCRLKEFLEWQ